jgi:hypothetical protein
MPKSPVQKQPDRFKLTPELGKRLREFLKRTGLPQQGVGVGEGRLGAKTAGEDPGRFALAPVAKL